MQKLENHIENLLRKHDFVIIPAFGGFVASEKSAQMENGYLLPPTRTVGFNPDLNYNDGLLAQEVAKGEGISLKEANAYIKESVEKLNNTLVNFKHLSFANIGIFQFNNDKVSFEPYKTNDLLIDSFGLQSFYFPEIVTNTISLSEKVREEKVRAEKEERQAKATKGFNYAIACVAAILLLLLVPLNFNQKQVVYRATFVPIQALDEVVITPDIEEEILSNLPKELSDSKIVYSDNRFRIITDSYETEEIGEIEIQKFAKKYPQFKDVWLLEYNP